MPQTTQTLSDLSVVVHLFGQLHGLAMRDADRSIAHIQAQAQIAIEAERARCGLSLEQTQSHWAALREIERQAREDQQARTNHAIELAAAENDDRGADMEDQLATLHQQLSRPVRQGDPTLLDKITPLLEQLAPIVLPKLLSMLDGKEGGARGTLPPDGE